MSTTQLAADVRAGIISTGFPSGELMEKGHAALDELMALVGTLQAAVVNTEAGVDVALQNSRLLNIARDLEIEVGTLQRERDSGEWGWGREWARRAGAAEAALAAAEEERDNWKASCARYLANRQAVKYALADICSHYGHLMGDDELARYRALAAAGGGTGQPKPRSEYGGYMGGEPWGGGTG